MKQLYGLALGIFSGFAAASALGAKPMETLGEWAGSLKKATGAAPTLPGVPSRDPLGGMMADDRLTRAVRERLADRAIAARRVDVTTVDGVVYLRGRVQDADEQTAVVGVAQDTPGVARVVDELKLTETSA